MTVLIASVKQMPVNVSSHQSRWEIFSRISQLSMARYEPPALIIELRGPLGGLKTPSHASAFEYARRGPNATQGLPSILRLRPIARWETALAHLRLGAAAPRAHPNASCAICQGIVRCRSLPPPSCSPPLLRRFLPAVRYFIRGRRALRMPPRYHLRKSPWIVP